MKKLKLQMQISLDGFVTADYGGTNFNWDNELRSFSIGNLKKADTILLGRNTAEDLITYWAGTAGNPNDADYELGKLITDTPKIVFSNSLKDSKWNNAVILSGDMVEEIKALKKKEGKDIIVYGGYSFVSSLIQNGLVDEFYLLVNPVALGSGQPIFQSLKANLQLTFKEGKPFSCGTVLLYYIR